VEIAADSRMRKPFGFCRRMRWL